MSEYEIRHGFVGQTIEGLEGQVADSLVVDLSIRADGDTWDPMRATVTINGAKLPVHPGLISFEIPQLDPLDSVTARSEIVDVVLRLRVKAEGLTLNPKRRH